MIFSWDHHLIVIITKTTPRQGFYFCNSEFHAIQHSSKRFFFLKKYTSLKIANCVKLSSSYNKSARRGGAPQASLDKRGHRNCFQTRPAIASISKKVNISEVRGQLIRSNSRVFSTKTICMLSVMITDFDIKGTISEVRVHAGAKFGHTGGWSIAKCSQSSPRNYTGGFRSWLPATCRLSTRRSFDHHGKEYSNFVQRRVSKNEKKWNLFVSLIDLKVMKTLWTVRLPVRPCAFFCMFLVTRPRSFWLKPKRKKTEDHKIRAVDRRCHARNTCTLHLQTRLSGRRNFFTVNAMRKKNFLLIRSWIEVDDRVNMSNHYSKSMMLAIHAHFPKLWNHLNALLRKLGGSKRVTLSSHWKPKA